MRKLGFLVAILLSSVQLSNAREAAQSPSNVSYHTDSIDAKTGMRTVVTNWIDLRDISEQEAKKARRSIALQTLTGISTSSVLDEEYRHLGICFSANTKTYQLIFSIHEPSQFTLEKNTAIKVTFTDNSQYTFHYEGPEVKSTEHKNGKSAALFTMDVNKKEIEVFANKEIASVSFKLKKSYKRLTSTFVTRHIENGQKVKAYAQDFLQKTKDIKLTQYNYLVNDIDEFTGNRKIETSFLPIRSMMMEMTISAVDTFYFVTLYAPEVTGCVSENSDKATFKFEDQTTNTYPVCMFRCPEKYNGLQVTVVKLSCGRAFVEKLAAKRLELIRLDQDETTYHYIRERVLKDKAIEYIHAYANDFIKKAVKLESEKGKGTDSLAKRVYPDFPYSGLFDKKEVDEETWGWSFTATPDEVSPEMAIQLYFDPENEYKIKGWVNTKKSVKTYKTAIYFKFADGTLRNAAFDDFNSSKETDEEDAYPFNCLFSGSIDLDLMKVIAEKKIEKIRVTVESTDNTNSFTNIEATLNADSQANIQNQAKDIVKYTTMERPVTK